MVPCFNDLKYKMTKMILLTAVTIVVKVIKGAINR